MLVILVGKENATIAVVAGVLRAANTKRDFKARKLHVFDQRHMTWASHRRLILGFAFCDFKGRIILFLAKTPSLRIEQLPAIDSRLKLLF